MFSVRLTAEFEAWLDGLRDKKAQIRVVARLRQAEAGNLGDWKSLGGGLSEMRVHVGAGHRLYFAQQGSILIVMLAGGDKSSQARDIKRARKLLERLEAEP